MGTLYVVGTPIGNMADITERALECLRSVDLIACEDTRHTGGLLARYEIKGTLVSYHQHSSLQKIDWLVDQLKQGRSVALVTDAGTPGISDPGGVLVDRVHQYNRHADIPIKIEVMPGPSSLTAALSVSGVPADNFLFLGFLPKKKGRQTRLRSLVSLKKNFGLQTVVFLESQNRIFRTLSEIGEVFGEEAAKVEVLLGRELTKKFEEIWRGTLPESIVKTETPQKGELVVVLRIVD